MTLNPRFVYGGLDLTDYPYSIEFGSDMGSAQNVMTMMSSLIADGDVLSLSRRENRAIALPVLVEGADLAEVAQNVAALVTEAEKRFNTLAVDPGDGFAATTVYKTFVAQANFRRDDDMETQGFRRVMLTIPAEPFPCSVDRIIDDGGTSPSTGTTVDECDTTTGWSSPNNAAAGQADPVVDTVKYVEATGSVQTVPYSTISGVNVWGQDYQEARHLDRKTLSVATGAGGFFSVHIRLSHPNSAYQPETTIARITMKSTLTPGGVDVDFFAAESLSDNWVRYAMKAPASDTITELEFEIYQRSSPITTPTVNYDKFVLSTSATAEQRIVKAFEVEGSARAPGSLYVASPDNAVPLGSLLVSTVHDDVVATGFRPDVRRWVTTGTVSSDATALDGGYYNVGADYSSFFEFQVPASILRPGPYSVVALVNYAGASSTVGVETCLLIDGVAVGPTSVAEGVVHDLGGWQLVVLGTVNLPPTQVHSPTPDSVVRVRPRNTKFAEILLIPATADFTIVDCGTGTASASGDSSHFWIDSPDPVQPRGGYWRGSEPERVDARSAWADLVKPGTHTFTPGLMHGFVLSTEAPGPTLTLDYFPHHLDMADQ